MENSQQEILNFILKKGNEAENYLTGLSNLGWVPSFFQKIRLFRELATISFKTRKLFLSYLKVILKKIMDGNSEITRELNHIQYIFWVRNRDFFWLNPGLKDLLVTVEFPMPHTYSAIFPGDLKCCVEDIFSQKLKQAISRAENDQEFSTSFLNQIERELKEMPDPSYWELLFNKTASFTIQQLD